MDKQLNSKEMIVVMLAGLSGVEFGFALATATNANVTQILLTALMGGCSAVLWQFRSWLDQQHCASGPGEGQRK